MEGTAMNRRLLVSLMALGAVITLVGAAGIFAVFTDRATTGTNSVTSGERPSAAHLQITTWQDGVCVGTPVDDLVTGLFEITDAQPTGFLGTPKYVCLMNAGASSLSLSVAALDLVDIETDCTGDEAAAGDASCGIVGGVAGAGELSQVLNIDIFQWGCTSAVTENNGDSIRLVDLAGGMLLGVPALTPGDTMCLRLRVLYPPGSPETAQIAQTDQATWRFAFDGTTS